jgi:hypothetical protein
MTLSIAAAVFLFLHHQTQNKENPQETAYMPAHEPSEYDPGVTKTEAEQHGRPKTPQPDYTPAESYTPPDTPKPIPNAIPVFLYVLADERLIKPDAYNIEGFKYFNSKDIAYILSGINGLSGQNALSILNTASGLTGTNAEALQLEPSGAENPISSHYIDGMYYYRLSDIARWTGIRLVWVDARNTLIADTGSRCLPDGQPVFKSEPLPGHIKHLIRGRSFREDTPFDYSYLAYLTITHVDFGGECRLGHMIVADDLAEEALEIFREIYEYRFPIERMRLIDFYNADDFLSMYDNNSSGFNFRYIANTRRISQHGLGRAIDINPVQNHYIRGDTVLPPAGAAYTDRSNVRPGMVVRGDVVYRAFTSRGWTWGGNWTLPRDYHHFEKGG